MNTITNIEVVEPIILIDENAVKNNLIENYSYLITNENQNQKTTKKNLVAELKKHFPKVKFSVKKEHSDCYGISWIEAVSIVDVDNVVSKFTDHKNDESGDFRDYAPSNFNRTFGGFKYIFTYRSFTESKKILLDQLSDLLEDKDKLYPNNVSDLLYRLLFKTEFPLSYSNAEIKVKEDFSFENIEENIYISFI